MKNITITLDDDTASQARVEAARQNVSLSRFVGELLQKELRESQQYNEAMQRYFNNKFVIHRQPGERLPTREELHDRSAGRPK